jgi:hypothetical protein
VIFRFQALGNNSVTLRWNQLLNYTGTNPDELKLLTSVVTSGGALLSDGLTRSNFDSSALVWSGYKLYDKSTKFQNRNLTGEIFTARTVGNAIMWLDIINEISGFVSKFVLKVVLKVFQSGPLNITMQIVGFLLNGTKLYIKTIIIFLRFALTDYLQGIINMRPFRKTFELGYLAIHFFKLYQYETSPFMLQL